MARSGNTTDLKSVEADFLALEIEQDEAPAISLRVQMFGGFSLYLGGRLVEPIASRTATSLLAFLIYRRDRQHTRDFVVGQFWPDLDESKARRRLSNALWQIGSVCKAAGFPSILERNKEIVALRSDLVVEHDVEAFDAGLDSIEVRTRAQKALLSSPEVATQLSALVSDYKELLAGHYSDWIDYERERLAQRYLDALALAVRVFQNCGDHDAALRYARQLVVAEPTREESHREVMRLCGILGQPGAAKRQYEACTATLRKELGVEPAEETTELLRRVERESSVSDVPPAGSSDHEPIFGRGPILTDLLSRVEDLMAGKGGIVLLEGEIGMGKSRLVAEMAEGARWRGATVSQACHNERSRWTPYGGLCEAIGPAHSSLKGEHVAELLGPFWVSLVRKLLPSFGASIAGNSVPTPTTLKGDEELWRTAEALARVVLALGRLTPTVLVLEDLQWADEEVLRTLKVLSKDLAESQVLLCLTYRRSEAQKVAPIWETLVELNAAKNVSRCELPPLSDGHMRQFVASMPSSSRLTEDAVEKLLNLVDGNPMLASQILQRPELLDSEHIGDSEMELAAADLMTEVVRSRLEAAGPEVGAVLELLAVLDEPAASKQVARLLGEQRQVVIANLSEGVNLRFLAESVDGCRFVSKEIRRLVYEQMPAERRRGLHERVLDDLSILDAEADQVLGHHAWHAERWQDAWKYYRRAALSDLTVHAYETASDLFGLADQAADKVGLSLVDWFEDAMLYENALDTLSRRADQASLVDRLEASKLTDLQRTEVTLRRVRLLAHTSRHEESAAVAEAAIAEAKRSGRNCGEIRAYAGASLYWAGKPAGAVEVLTKAVSELNEAGSSSAEASIWLAKAHIDRQNLDDARSVLDEAALLAQPAENLRFQVDALAAKASIHTFGDNFEEAICDYKESLSLSRRIGYLRGEAVNLVNLGSSYTLVGNGGAAVAAFESASELLPMLSEQRGQAFVDTNSAELHHRLLGDDEKARELASRAAVFFRSMDDARMDAHCLDVLARIDLRAGRRSRARAMLLEAANRKEVVDDQWFAVQIKAGLCEAHIELGDYDETLSVADEALEMCEALSLNGLVPGLLATKALALVKLGRKSEAIEVVRQVVERNASKYFYAYEAAWRAAEVFGLLGDVESHTQQTQVAHGWLQLNLADLEPERQARAWKKVPAHAAIKKAYELLVPVVERISLPRLSSTSGNEVGEWVEVDLTLSTPDDWRAASEAERRQRRLERVWNEAHSQNAEPRVQDLANFLDVSERTVKRDLSILRSGGSL